MDVCVRVCVRACTRVCVRVCVYVRVCMYQYVRTHTTHIVMTHYDP